MTTTTGIEFRCRDGSESAFYQLLESVGVGGAALDFDRDGRCDLYFNGGGRFRGPPVRVEGFPSGLFRNDGIGGFEDVSAAAVPEPGFFTHGCTVADVDGDGFCDLIVAGYGGVEYLWNDGTGHFERRPWPGVDPGTWYVTPIPADFDGDGLVDVHLVTYAEWEPDGDRRCLNDRKLRDVCAPTLFEGFGDQLWRNTGTGAFEDVSRPFGLVDSNRGLGGVAVDFDENGWIDLFVANDVEANQFYANHDGTFRERGVLEGVAFSDDGQREGSMGVDAGDFDGDLQPDLWYTNYANQDNALRQRVDHGFAPAGGRVGLDGRSRPWVGFGTGFADFDADGWEDLYVLNGHVAYDRRDSPYFQPAQLFRNAGGERFVEVSEEAAPYFTVPRAGRGGIVADFEDDGGLDLVILHQNDPVTVLRNRQPADHWIAFDPVGTTCDRDAVGAKITLESGGRLRARWRLGGGGYLSARDRRIWFALAEGGPVDAEVRWPNGNVERFAGLQPRGTRVLVEGRGEPVE